MSKTKDNVEGQSNKEELDSQKEVSDKSESADKPYAAFEQIKSLEDVIGRLHAEADFAAKAFGGNTQEAIRSLKDLKQELSSILVGFKQPLSEFSNYNKTFGTLIQTISLLPNKTEDVLKELVPDIGKEVEKVHDQRMIKIESILKKLQKQLSDEVLATHKILEQTALNSIEQINKAMLKQLGQQEKQFLQFSEHAKNEIEAVTSNHGTKFLRNTAICLILATITGSISGWYTSEYFPRLVKIERTGDVIIQNSHVAVDHAYSIKDRDQK